MSEERQSGRTTALLEQALAHAREGSNVFFLVANDPMVVYAQALAEHLAKALISQRTGKSSAFPGTLRVRKRVAGQYRELRGTPRLMIVQDHFWLPWRPC